jgi:hypothetical protein
MAQAKKINDSDAQPASISGRVDPKIPQARYQIGTAALSSKPTHGIAKPALSRKPAGGPLSAYLKRTRSGR